MVKRDLFPDTVLLDSFELLENFFDPTQHSQKIGFPSNGYFVENEGYYIEMSIVGVPKENVEISFDEQNHLIVDVKQQEEKENEKNKTYYFRKLKKIHGKKMFLLIDPKIDKEKIEATFENGLLTIFIPIKESEKPKKIEIK